MKDIRSELKVLLDAEKVQNRIAELAVEISNDFKNKPVKIICVLRGGIFFTVDLTKKLDLIFDMDFVEISSYGDGRESSGNIIVKKDLTDTENLNEKHLIILEDIIDTGKSLKFLTEYLKKFNPLSISSCVLLDKKSRRTENIVADYVGFVIPDRFIVGYGLDYCNHFRNIDYIGYLEN